MQILDEKIFNIFYSLSGHSSIGDSIIIALAGYFPVVVVILVLVTCIKLFFFDKTKKAKKKAWKYVLALVCSEISIAVVKFINYIYHHDRPFITLKLAPLFQETSYSFPSSHAIFFFSLAMGVYFVSKRFGITLFVFATIISLARISAGVHYPSDVIGGALLGVVISYLIFGYQSAEDKKR